MVFPLRKLNWGWRKTITDEVTCEMLTESIKGLWRERSQCRNEHQVRLGLLPTGEAMGTNTEIRHVANSPPDSAMGRLGPLPWTSRAREQSVFDGVPAGAW